MEITVLSMLLFLPEAAEGDLFPTLRERTMVLTAVQVAVEAVAMAEGLQVLADQATLLRFLHHRETMVGEARL
jgi:hypothetical protein